MTPGVWPYQIVMGVSTASVAGIVALLGELRDELGLSSAAIGIIVSAGFLAAFVAQITLAPLADRGHARRMIGLGLAMTVFGLAAMVVADSVVVLTGSRALVGFGAGLVMPGLRRAVTVLDPERVGENLGRLIVGEIAGYLAGPITAGALAAVGGVRLPFAAFAVVLVLFVPLALRLPPDTGRKDPAAGRLAFDLLRIRRLQGALVLIAGYFVVIGAFESVVPVMYHDRGASALATGLAFTGFTLPILFVSPLAGRVADRVGAARIASLGIFVVAATSAFYGILPGYVWPAVLMGAAGVADGFGFTGAQVAVSRSVPEERQAAALGLMGATQVAAAGLAAAPAAVLYASVGAAWAWVILAAVALAIVGVAQLLFRGTEPIQGPQPDPLRV